MNDENSTVSTQKSELLAPAGDKESFFAAVNNGADAVYLGLTDFSARKSAANFSEESLKYCLDYAHLFGVKVYVAVNTSVKTAELPALFQAIEGAWQSGADAFIMQDIFFGALLKKSMPELNLHLSTQAGINNARGALLAKEAGFSRVILARETALKEIEEIAKIIETEVFVQGALCTCVSGQCYMSSFAGGNSGNRGLCKQPCRQRYSLNGGDECYPVSLADLCVGDRVKELIAAGVTSLKIEGRMRRPEYVAASVKYYRGILAEENSKENLRDLKRTFNRGEYTEGLAFGQKEGFISDKVQGHVGERVGVVNRVSGNLIQVKGSHNPEKGDGFKILRNGLEVGGGEVKDVRFTATGFMFEAHGDIRVGDAVCVTTDTALNRRLLSTRRTLPITISFFGQENAPAKVRVCAQDKCVEVSTEVALPKAESRPLSADDVRAVFEKTDDYPYQIAEFTADISGSLFGVKSVMNKLRREAYAALFQAVAARPPRANKTVEIAIPQTADKASRGEAKLAVIAEDFSFTKVKSVDIAVFSPSDYSDLTAFKAFFEYTEGAERYLYAPAFMNDADIELFTKRLEGFDGIYGEGTFALALAEEQKLKFFAGTGINIFNSLTATEVAARSTHFAFSKELTRAETDAEPLSEQGFTLALGNIKVMDLAYCPFKMRCAKCRIGTKNTLVDYAGRVFPVRRVKLSRCYFEVYNSSELISERGKNALCDFVLTSPAEVIKYLTYDAERLKQSIPHFTSGHSKNPTL